SPRRAARGGGGGSGRGGEALRLRAVVPGLVRAAFACLFVVWTTLSLPFYPMGWPVGLAALAAGATYLRPRLGLAFALLVPVLPLGNYALGAALLYGAIAACVLVACWRAAPPRPFR